MISENLSVNALGHLNIGENDAVELAKEYGRQIGIYSVCEFLFTI